MQKNLRVSYMEQFAFLSKDYKIDCSIAGMLPSTWHAFFQIFGRLKAVQREVIPNILRGEDVLIVSGTASGKTEAACAPLVERNLLRKEPWTILYIAPTRALVNDLYERLYMPAQRLNLRIKRRTGDHRDDLTISPNILITTPESFDSMLCRNWRENHERHDLENVVAVVLDEIHLLYGTPRGEQVRWLLERLKKLRIHAASKKWTNDSKLQILGLSATVPAPEEVKWYYFSERAAIVKGENGRNIKVVTIHPDSTSENNSTVSALKAYIKQQEEPEKILIFSNSRKRVDNLAEALKTSLEPLGYDVYAHHGSLDRKIRESTEEAAKKRDKIVVCSTSTLEIGIDIGNIDLVCLDGPAPNVSSFLQRIGRGNRRTGETRLMPLYESIEEFIIHSAQIEAARDGWLGEGSIGPEYAVLRQQIASYIFQSKKNKRSLQKLKELFTSDLLNEEVFDSILRQMVWNEELKEEGISNSIFKLGQYWLDETQEMGKIHSNIDSKPGMTIVDRNSGQPIAKDLIHKSGKNLSIGGNKFEICKWKNWTIEVKKAVKDCEPSGLWQYVPSSGHINSNQPATVKYYLEIDQNIWPVVKRSGYMYVFHFGGARTHAFLELVVKDYSLESKINEINDWYICFHDIDFSGRPEAFTRLNLSMLKLSLQENEKLLSKLEKIMSRPHANKTLPLKVRLLEIWGWLNPDFEIKSLINSSWEVLKDKEKENVLAYFL
ncbi:DEAD/DEAH box helicase [Methanosarcina sp. DH1]|uniref:DEAD/DEAH box helicase n=1 Tax=Methanosarcina sp. DH1 TaxID=2605695 RepID=UPI001E40A191|nr:DEAD/DEAH box helicase [Methanosarcina sp. DH1]